MTKVSCKSLLVYGALIICAVVVSLDRGGVQAAGTDPTSTQVAGPGVLDLPKEVEPTMESMLGDYLAGNFALDSGNIKDAVSYFQRALADDPDNLELRRQVFLLDLADGRYDAALEEARALKRVETEAINEDAQLLLALESVKQQAFEDVPEVLKDIGDQGIVALAAPFVLAWSSISAKGDTGADEAIALLHGGESLGPLNDYHEALLLGFSGRVDEALNKLTDIVPETGAAPTRVARAYAEFLLRLDKGDEAVAFLEEQLLLSERPVLRQALGDLRAGGTPGLPFTDGAGGMADALLGIAEALQQERGSARAVLYARLALYLRPDLAEGKLLIGDILSGQDNFDAAIEAYEAIDAASPISTAAKIRKAQALHEQEREDAAFRLLEEIASTEPKSTNALIQLGNLLRRDELYERAAQAYSRAIERLETPEQEHWTLYYSRGIAFERTKRWPEAEADFLFALELQPEQPFVLNYLGYSWVDQGLNLDQAQDMLHRAVEARPDDGFIVDSLGWVYYRLKNYDQAVEQLERAVELQPGDPVINDHLGDAYWRVGREREAHFQWRRSLTLEPEDDVVTKIREKLRVGLQDDRS